MNVILVFDDMLKCLLCLVQYLLGILSNLLYLLSLNGFLILLIYSQQR